ncbi:hypothetical protein BDN72DRAFT_877192 [Pluteus cervinus]|uniref:Uncharacterized protein n=1 Tax=Pluteus cervinus TaxID=181527 RepID=A0ACD3B0R0_9AGAR|nr:hypothetical protein BDN72DRAFT_877192 [Pluteus cervinus]
MQTVGDLRSAILKRLDDVPNRLLSLYQFRIPLAWREGTSSQSTFLQALAELKGAYFSPFVGDAAAQFLAYTRECQQQITEQWLNLYSKFISIVQSSGTGKSRTLAEIGREIFTLPMCLRCVDDPGYPSADSEISHFIRCFDKTTDKDIRSHQGLAALFGAAYYNMLLDLKRFRQDGKDVRQAWYEQMESQNSSPSREAIYKRVVATATKPTPRAIAGEEDALSKDVEYYSRVLLNQHLGALTNWLHDELKYEDVCITYIDEAQELKELAWVMQRLARDQHPSCKMWYVYMGKKSSIKYVSPQPKHFRSVCSRIEISKLLPAYYALGFDQNITADLQTPGVITMGYLSSFSHIANYGRPLWGALAKGTTRPDDIMQLASAKLINNDPGKAILTNCHHAILAVLSQRLCIDIVIGEANARELTDHSISDHMRLLCGISEDCKTYYPSSPSKPILAIAAAQILYRRGQASLSDILAGFDKYLCSTGLVEKGLLGELAARLLVLTSRDYAAPLKNGIRDFLKPVPLVDVLKNLFRETQLGKLLQGLAGYYVNFTHWAVTKEPLPDKIDRNVLANLWERSLALQCCFNQASFDCLSSHTKARLSPTVKLKKDGDSAAKLRPIGLPLGEDPLPYLATLMELGTEQDFKTTQTRVKVTLPSPGSYSSFLDACYHTRKAYEEAKVQKKYNRFEIKARGSSAETYRILEIAGIEGAFSDILQRANPQPHDATGRVPAPTPRKAGPITARESHVAWMKNYIDSETATSSAGTPMDM